MLTWGTRIGLRRGAGALLVAGLLVVGGCTADTEEPAESGEAAGQEDSGTDDGGGAKDGEGDEDGERDPGEAEADEPADLPSVRSGETVPTVQGGPGEWEGVLVVDEPGVVVLEAVTNPYQGRAELTITGPDGHLWADEEDRRSQSETWFSDADQLDPLVIRPFEAGEYHLYVRGFSDPDSSFEFEDAELRVWVPDRVEVDSTTDLEIADGLGGGFVRLLTLPEDGEYAFTATATTGYTEPGLTVIRAHEKDERALDLPNLYDVHVDGVAQLREELPAGEYVVLVFDGFGNPGSVTFEIEGP